MSTTAWVLIWVLLFVSALVFFVLVGLHLYKKFLNLMDQTGDSAQVFDEFAQAVESIEEQTYQPHNPIGASHEQKEKWRHDRRVNLIRRKKRKELRRKITLARWRNTPNRVTKA